MKLKPLQMGDIITVSTDTEHDTEQTPTLPTPPPPISVAEWDAAGLDGSTIREARERRGISQEALAQAMGVTVKSVSNWEDGFCRPQRIARRRLLELLQLPVPGEAGDDR